MAFSSGVENPHFLPVACLLSSVIHLTHRASSPCALHTLSCSPRLSVQHQHRSGPSWAAKAIPVVFPEYGNRICGCNPGLSPFSERMVCLIINGTVDKAVVSENLKELVGALCNLYYCSSAKHLSSLFSKPHHSYMVWLVYKQEFIAKYFVGA